MVSDNQGSYTKQKRLRAEEIPDNNTNHQRVAYEGDYKECLSWPHFLRFWNDHYRHLKINMATEDICGHCYRFYNSYKYAGKQKSFFFSSRSGCDEVEGGMCKIAEDLQNLQRVIFVQNSLKLRHSDFTKY